jgi:hypothetical protein
MKRKLKLTYRKKEEGNTVMWNTPMWQATYTTTSLIVLQSVSWNIDSIMLLRHQQYYCSSILLNIHSFTSVSIGISKNRLPTVPVPRTSCSFTPSTLNKDHQSAMHPTLIE